MKRILLILICALMFSFTTARAYERTDSIHPPLPPLTIRVTDAGENGGMLRENLLRVQIAAQDGSFEQELVWQSAETSAHDGAAALAFWNCGQGGSTPWAMRLTLSLKRTIRRSSF